MTSAINWMLILIVVLALAEIVSLYGVIEDCELEIAALNTSRDNLKRHCDLKDIEIAQLKRRPCSIMDKYNSLKRLNANDDNR